MSARGTAGRRAGFQSFVFATQARFEAVPLPPDHQFQRGQWRSLIKSIWHRSANERRWRRACRFLDTLSKSRRPFLAIRALQIRSDPTLVKSPLKVAVQRFASCVDLICGCTARELKSIFERSQGYHLWLSSCCRQEGKVKSESEWKRDLTAAGS